MHQSLLCEMLTTEENENLKATDKFTWRGIKTPCQPHSTETTCRSAFLLYQPTHVDVRYRRRTSSLLACSRDPPKITYYPLCTSALSSPFGGHGKRSVSAVSHRILAARRVLLSRPASSWSRPALRRSVPGLVLHRYTLAAAPFHLLYIGSVF